MPETYFSNFLKRFYILTKKVRLIWALCAVILIMFGLDFSPIMSTSVAASPYEYTQTLTAVSGSNLPVQSQSEIVSATKNAPTQLAQAATTKPQGQVKALATITIPVSSMNVTRSICGVSLYTGAYTCFTDGYGTVGVGSGTTFDYRLIGFVSMTKATTAQFNLSSLPAGQSVISATLNIWYSSCYNYAYSVLPYAGITGCSGNAALGPAGAAAIQASKPSNNFVLSFTGGSNFAEFSNFAIIVTYGNRTVDLKANGSDGPITVKGGTNVNLNWDYTGFSQCSFGANPSWYTPQWPLGQNTLAGTGTASTKIYYESVTYNLVCRDSGSGATGADNVTVNVTP